MGAGAGTFVGALQFVFALRYALSVGTVADFGGGQGQLALRKIEDSSRFGGAIGRADQRFGARGFGKRKDVLGVAVCANALQLAQFGGFAGDALEPSQELAFLGVGRGTQLVDGVADATSRGLFTSRGAERTLAEQHEQRQQRETSERASQSATFGGGPIWMRSPR